MMSLARVFTISAWDSCFVNIAPANHLSFLVALILLDQFADSGSHCIHVGTRLWQLNLTPCIKYSCAYFSIDPWQQDNSFEQIPTTVECREALPLIHDGSPLTPPNSASGSAQSVVSEPAVIWDENHEINSGEYNTNCDGESHSLYNLYT